MLKRAFTAAITNIIHHLKITSRFIHTSVDISGLFPTFATVDDKVSDLHRSSVITFYMPTCDVIDKMTLVRPMRTFVTESVAYTVV